MMERGVVEYIANALWQVPLLAGGAWLFLWAARPGPRTQYGVWLGVLGLAVLLTTMVKEEHVKRTNEKSQIGSVG